MRPAVILIISSVLAGACSQLLGIDGRYSPQDQDAPGAAGNADLGEADASKGDGTGGTSEVPPNLASAGNGGTSGAPPGELGPPVFEMGGEPAMSQPPPPLDAGDQSCTAGTKACGGKCAPLTPEVGCGGISCTPCIAYANAHTSCGKDGACESPCNQGYTPLNHQCVPEPVGTGGSVGAGGAGGSGGTTGAGGETGAGGQGGDSTTCNPNECPACSRGFEGCCIPAVPGGPSARCGCFYFPPLCTARVG